MRYTVVLLALSTALSVAACGSSGNPTAASGTSSSATSTPPGSTSPSSSPTSTPQHPSGKDHVAGLIATVSGTTVQVTQKNGNATVAFTNATPVSEVDPAQLSDLTAGSCVTVQPTRDSAPASSGSITARAVTIGTPSNGSCSPTQGEQGGQGDQSGRGGHGVRGTVASVNGNTVIVSTAGNPAQVNVALTDTTDYTKRTASDPQAIAPGKCIAARGTKDSGGVLQATTITLRPATNGSCTGVRQ